MMPQNIKNLGPVSWQALSRVGIKNAETLRKVGAVGAYVMMLEEREPKGKLSLNFLYAMEAGIRGVHWQAITNDDKGRLGREVADFIQSRSPLTS